jgi:hypothetical protein
MYEDVLSTGKTIWNRKRQGHGIARNGCSSVPPLCFLSRIDESFADVVIVCFGKSPICWHDPRQPLLPILSTAPESIL